MPPTFSFFGSTIRETINAFKYQKLKANMKTFDNGKIYNLEEAGEIRVRYYSDKVPKLQKIFNPIDNFEVRTKAIMRIVVTLILLGISVYLLVFNSSESKTLPCSIISAVTGYWLK